MHANQSYCALFPEDDKIDRNELIEYMIVEGIIDDVTRRQEKFDKGHTMLDRLENACLLEGDTHYVWMHDLIRDMMILELRQGSKTLVEAGAQLKDLPDVKKWTESLVRVSLMSNDIEAIHPGGTPKCPNLSTLLLCRNQSLKMIADSFLQKFQKLKILDLSCCDEIEKLPNSISALVNLTALLLRYCWKLTYVPSLERLKKLEKLDLSHCERLEEIEGLIFLLKLKYLDLSGTRIKLGGREILPKLIGLQVLKLHDEYGHSDFSIKGSEVKILKMLETLHCIFGDVKELMEAMNSRPMSLIDYSIFIQREYPYWKTSEYSKKLGSRKFVSITSYDFIHPWKLPADIEALHIYNCSSTKYNRLFTLGILANLTSLQDICVENWYGIEIFAFKDDRYQEDQFVALTSDPFDFFRPLRDLKLISVRGCHQLKKLFPHILLPNLHNLEKLSVGFCNDLEEIFSTDEIKLILYPRTRLEFRLSRLTSLNLHDLPKLRSLYKGAIMCDSLKEIELVDCPNLKRIPLSLPQPSLESIKAYPKKWWESLQWGSVDDKKHLESFCVFNK